MGLRASLSFDSSTVLSVYIHSASNPLPRKLYFFFIFYLINYSINYSSSVDWRRCLLGFILPSLFIIIIIITSTFPSSSSLSFSVSHCCCCCNGFALLQKEIGVRVREIRIGSGEISSLRSAASSGGGGGGAGGGECLPAVAPSVAGCESGDGRSSPVRLGAAAASRGCGYGVRVFESLYRGDMRSQGDEDQGSRQR